jgi:hypothetical protein
MEREHPQAGYSGVAASLQGLFEKLPKKGAGGTARRSGEAQDRSKGKSHAVGSKTAVSNSTLKLRARFRTAGVIVLLLGIGGAFILYWIRTRNVLAGVLISKCMGLVERGLFFHLEPQAISPTPRLPAFAARRNMRQEL